ncbi:MAG: PQQ-dependent sugar dehydrogenase [Anaerolineae bacterium]|nr:PQQ-dependent sugar dehydrogenase [Candidatus Roseilinea sp.]MDW8451376.1 PQQ-dependent sugar dehydrogenase [Anaerolineae bacterium]
MTALLLGVLIARLYEDQRRLSGVLFAIFGALIISTMAILSFAVKTPDGASLIDINLLDMVRTVAKIALPLLVGIAVSGVLIASALRFLHTSKSWVIWLAPSVLLAASLAGVNLLVKSSLAQTAVVHSPEHRGGIMLLQGFDIEYYYDYRIEAPSAMAFGPDGNLYVALLGGKIIILHDSRHVGRADRMTVFADGLDKPTALAWHGNDLYVQQAGKLTILRDTAKRGRADWSKDIVTDLPAYLYPLHANHGLAFGPDGRVYFGVGSTTNASPETNPLAARIWSVNPDGSDLQEFAYGVRNPYGMAFNSAGDLFVTDNAPNWEGTTPGDELKHIVKGGQYGFPNFGEPPPNAAWRGPVVIFPQHVSPTGIAFYNGHQFPEAFQDNAFVALWNTGQLVRIQLSKLADGSYAAKWHYFAQGLKNPVAVVVGMDGSLFVADFGEGAIYRITATASAHVELPITLRDRNLIGPR